MAGLVIAGQAGPQAVADGTSGPPRLIRTGELGVSEIHGRFYEQTFRGNVYSGGMQLTSINNATFTTGTLGPTATPIVGVWNPGTSPVNVVILQAQIQVVLTALAATGPGSFHWATSVGNNALTLGTAPLNRKTLAQSGSQAKDMSGISLTGLTNNLVARNAAGIAGGSLYNISNTGIATGFETTMAASVENIDGAWIVPPGGVFALLCTTTPVAHSAGSGLIWEEVAIS